MAPHHEEVYRIHTPAAQKLPDGMLNEIVQAAGRMLEMETLKNLTIENMKLGCMIEEREDGFTARFPVDRGSGLRGEGPTSEAAVEALRLEVWAVLRDA